MKFYRRILIMCSASLVALTLLAVVTGAAISSQNKTGPSPVPAPTTSSGCQLTLHSLHVNHTSCPLEASLDPAARTSPTSGSAQPVSPRKPLRLTKQTPGPTPSTAEITVSNNKISTGSSIIQPQTSLLQNGWNA